MFIKASKIFSIPNLLVFALAILLSVISVNAQTTRDNADSPFWKGYKDITIGMTMDEVKAKLGAPKSLEGDNAFYAFSETETCDILFDANQKVRAISVYFSEEHTGAPKFEDIFGKKVTPQMNPDGSVFKIVRYYDAGFWVSYSRLAGEKALVTVTIQKL